jgi:hypothetical protein
VVVGEGVVVDAVVDFRVGVARPFGAELPDGPVFAMFGIEEFDKRVERVAVRALGVGATGPGRRDNCKHVISLRRVHGDASSLYCCLSHSRGRGRLQHAWRVARLQFGAAETPNNCQSLMNSSQELRHAYHDQTRLE